MRLQWKGKVLVAVAVPVLLFALLISQLHGMKKTLRLRNSYILETLPSQSQWIWDSVSGQLPQKLINDKVLTHDGNVNAFNKIDQVENSGLGPHNQSFAKGVLRRGYPTLIVHYIWCVDGHFELTHYISVLSVLHQLLPDSIVIHYRIKPRADPAGYWRWLEDLLRDVVFLTLRPLHNSAHCGQSVTVGLEEDLQDFKDPYGLFILGNVVISNLTRNDVVTLMADSFHVGSISQQQDPMLARAQVYLVGNSEAYHITKSFGRVVVPCPTLTDFNVAKTVVHTPCIDVNSYIHPDELFYRDKRFFRFARNLMYGSPSPIQIDKVDDEIPNIVHIILPRGGEITPLLYVSIKSAYKKFFAAQVFVHGPECPHGDLLDRLVHKDEVKPHYIPTAPFEDYSKKNGEFVYALYTLLQHGGIMHFGDVVFMNPLFNRKLPAIASLQHSRYRMKHRLLSMGVFGATKGSKFIETLLPMVRQTDTSWPEATVNDMATHINELYPSSVMLNSLFTTHLSCDLVKCKMSGGYTFSGNDLTSVRLIFHDNQPTSLEQLQGIEGSARSLINNVISASSHSHGL